MVNNFELPKSALSGILHSEHFHLGSFLKENQEMRQELHEKTMQLQNQAYTLNYKEEIIENLKKEKQLAVENLGKKEEELLELRGDLFQSYDEDEIQITTAIVGKRKRALLCSLELSLMFFSTICIYPKFVGTVTAAGGMVELGI